MDKIPKIITLHPKTCTLIIIPMIIIFIFIILFTIPIIFIVISS